MDSLLSGLLLNLLAYARPPRLAPEARSSSLWILMLGVIWWREWGGEERKTVPLSGTDIRLGEGGEEVRVPEG